MDQPAITPITMPKWGLSMQEGKVVNWVASVGTTVLAGDQLLDIETEKIANTFEALEAGLLRRQVAKDNIRVGAIAPGAVANELWGIHDPAEIERLSVKEHGYLTSEDVANAVAFMLSQPPHVTIRDLVMLPQNQDL